MRRATDTGLRQDRPEEFLSTLSLRRATRYVSHMGSFAKISIHALLAESDIMHALELAGPVLFLSTLSLRRATFRLFRLNLQRSYFYPRSPCGERPLLSLPFRAVWIISIHALLAESDKHIVGTSQVFQNFYPRSPCGERPFIQIKDTPKTNFYPRSPCGERLTLICPVIAAMTISIHALLAESD